MPDPSDLLPHFLDPVLDYLADHLPPPLYDALLSVLSHALALLTTLFSLVTTLISAKPWEWDAQTVIPPLISFLAAYLAIVSLYRTTSWIFKTAVWFVKWGSIIAALIGGIAWYVAEANNYNIALGGQGGGLLSTLGGLLYNVIVGEDQNTGRGSRSRRASQTPRSTKTHSKSKGKSGRTERPKPWDSFKEHEEWRQDRYADERERDRGEAQKIMSDIADAAQRVLVEGGWWNAAKSVWDGIVPPPEETDQTERRRTGGRSSRSR